MSGLEALGAASAILSFITFSANVITLCKAIHDGKETATDILEEQARLMHEAAQKNQKYIEAGRSQNLTAEEKELRDVAAKCQEAAKKLESEAQSITKLQQKRNVFRTVHAVIRSSARQRKLNELEKELSQYKAIMDSGLLHRILTREDALHIQQSQHFQSLSDDMKSLVQQIITGQKGIEDAIHGDGLHTRTHVSREMTDAEQSIRTHMMQETERAHGLLDSSMASNLQTMKSTAETEAQQQRFLQSFKFPEMNQRYHSVVDPSDATFGRVFDSFRDLTQPSIEPSQGYSPFESSVEGDSSIELYQGPTNSDFPQRKQLREIDEVWGAFVDWLRTDDDRLFWIQGKPGSGKSTLVKFIIENENTKRLLSQSQPGIVIVSHFFWKIGSAPQNSIKGFLCTIIHQLLDKSRSKIGQVLARCDSEIRSKDSYHDWSTNHLKTILFFLLTDEAPPVCCFIDALDEVCKEEPEKLVSLIYELRRFENLKMCVSSRAERFFEQRLTNTETSMLRLSDLTRPDMKTYVHKKLEDLKQRQTLPKSLERRLANSLVDKANGVFLWLQLATRSIIKGAENLDTAEELLQRLEELPGELEELYADMWGRLNEDKPIYQRVASECFHLVLNGGAFVKTIGGSTLTFYLATGHVSILMLACARYPGLQASMLSGDRSLSADEVWGLCEKTRNEIDVRCAGLLEVFLDDRFSRYPKDLYKSLSVSARQTVMAMSKWHALSVRFIHRTAHDFLVGTQAGQDILAHHKQSSLDCRLSIIKYALCTASTLPGLAEVGSFMDSLARVLKNEPEVAHASDVMIDLLRAVEDHWRTGVLVAHEHYGGPYSRPAFLAWVVGTMHHFDDYVICVVEQADSPHLAQHILDKLWLPPSWSPSVYFVQRLESLGADPHAPSLTGTLLTAFRWFGGPDIMVHPTAFSRLLAPSAGANLPGPESKMFISLSKSTAAMEPLDIAELIDTLVSDAPNEHLVQDSQSRK